MLPVFLVTMIVLNNFVKKITESGVRVMRTCIKSDTGIYILSS